jgi:hypothetical protein
MAGTKKQYEYSKVRDSCPGSDSVLNVPLTGGRSQVNPRSKVAVGGPLLAKTVGYFGTASRRFWVHYILSLWVVQSRLRAI